ncbi:MAG: hypothetical protein KatS3mg118_2211 [Paracoccaceae bacterium]|nr:MAG: hypothetical protein KatS3mg118_2211 [Paracoccaceae bacterium]
MPDRPALPAALRRHPVAHRGLHDPARGVIENSRAAIARAAAAGYGVEIDIQLSADGEAMVFHDDDLERLTPEAGPLRLRSAAELSRIPLRGSAETIPHPGRDPRPCRQRPAAGRDQGPGRRPRPARRRPRIPRRQAARRP